MSERLGVHTVDPTVACPARPRRSIYRRVQPWVSLFGCAAGLILLALTAFVGQPPPNLGLLLFACGLAARLPLSRIYAFASGVFLWSIVWFVFTAIRGFGDDLGMSGRTRDVVPTVERWLFGGRLPSAHLQAWFYDPGHPHWYDWFLGGVYASFFAVPSILAIFAMAKNRPLFRTHVRVLAVMLTFGCLVFAVLPTNPPWMAADRGSGENVARAGYDSMERFRNAVFGPQADGQKGLLEDNNPLAAMPSIHVATTALLYFLARRFGRRRWQVLALAYTIVMGCALVYLGEHYVLDVAAGLGLTALSWRLAADVSLGRFLSPLARLVPRSSTTESAVPVPHPKLVENAEDRAA